MLDISNMKQQNKIEIHQQCHQVNKNGKLNVAQKKTYLSVYSF